MPCRAETSGAHPCFYNGDSLVGNDERNYGEGEDVKLMSPLIVR